MGAEGLLLRGARSGLRGRRHGLRQFRAARVRGPATAPSGRAARRRRRTCKQLAVALGAAAGLHTFPSVLKEAMGMIGLPAGPCRKPMGPSRRKRKAQLAAVIETLAQEGYLAKGQTSPPDA